jgi:hypothetical protein
LPRAVWEGWRASLGWGVATLIVALAFGLFVPDTLVYPLGDSRVTAPVLAFEFARDANDLVAVFGAVGDPSHPARLAGFRAGNLLDYLFLLTYGSFLLTFFRASAADMESPRWRTVGWLAPIAAASDGVENAILLSLNADLSDPLPRLAVPPWPVWIKFGLLSALSGAAGAALWRQRAWPLAPQPERETVPDRRHRGHGASRRGAVAGNLAIHRRATAGPARYRVPASLGTDERVRYRVVVDRGPAVGGLASLRLVSTRSATQLKALQRRPVEANHAARVRKREQRLRWVRRDGMDGIPWKSGGIIAPEAGCDAMFRSRTSPRPAAASSTSSPAFCRAWN